MELVKMKNRQEFNRQLVRQLSTLIEAYPDLRFSQALNNFGFVENKADSHGMLLDAWRDEYNLEPDLLLKRVLGKVTTLGARLYEDR